MQQEILQLSYKYTDNRTMDHARRLATKALDYGWSPEIVAACYAHAVLEQNYDLYYEILNELKAIDENVATIVEKVTKRANETWGQYYYRVTIVPEATKVLWLDMIDSLYHANKEEFDRIYEQLPRFYNKIWS